MMTKMRLAKLTEAMLAKTVTISEPEVVTGGCICGHGFNDHEHPAKPWMAINSKMMDTELAACKLCDCDMWREPESLMDNDEEE